MSNKKQTIFGIGLTLFILFGFICQTVSETNTCVGKRLTTRYANDLAQVKGDNQTFYQSRDFLCHRQEEKEVLSRSKKDKILVTQ